MSSYGLNDDAQHLILAGLRDSTKKQYCHYIEQWISYCTQMNIQWQSATGADVINFLTSLHTRGLGYSAINTAKSALSSVLPAAVKREVYFGTNSLTCRLLKGVFNTRPSLPRYTVTWHTDLVLRYLETQTIDACSLKDLTLKLTMLLALCSAQRLQGLRALSINTCVFSSNSCVFYINKMLKTTRIGRHQQPIKFTRFENRELCVLTHLEKYIAIMQKVRGGHDQLLLSYVKPHCPVREDTISRWLKTILRAAGIDTQQFTAHSTRSAGTSKAARVESVPIDAILKSAGWVQESTFRKFYNRDVSCNDENNFAHAVLHT